MLDKLQPNNALTYHIIAVHSQQHSRLMKKEYRKEFASNYGVTSLKLIKKKNY